MLVPLLLVFCSVASFLLVSENWSGHVEVAAAPAAAAAAVAAARLGSSWAYSGQS